MENLDQRQAEAFALSAPITLSTAPRVQWVRMDDIAQLNELKARLKHLKPAVKIGSNVRLLEVPSGSQQN
jgi:hypothetical protein